MGLDVFAAGLEESESSSSQNDKQHAKSSSKNNATILKSITPILQRITSFGQIFVTNTILGMSVFATYEGVIESLAPAPDSTGASTNIQMLCNSPIHVTEGNETTLDLPSDSMDEHNDAMDRATLPQHFLAGGLGGMSHAVLSLGFETKVSTSNALLTNSSRMTNYTLAKNALALKPIHLHVPTITYSYSSILHHSLAHSVLFGSYQGTKIFLMQHMSDPLSGSNDVAQIASISIAGGVAGQFQHAISHLSEQWLGLTDEVSSSSILGRVRLATLPSWRSTLLAFPPSAIGFLAFEYGKIAFAGDDT